jgi:uncharacterized membrane protein
MNHETESHLIDRLLDAVEYFAVALELLAVCVVVVGVLYSTFNFLHQDRTLGKLGAGYQPYRVNLGRTLLLGLEILVAADIVRTVALDQTLENVAILGFLVVIRTFLSWSLEVEIENRWPWHPRKTSQSG